MGGCGALPPSPLPLSTFADPACAWYRRHCITQVAILLAPVAFVTHMDSLPMNALAALDTDQVSSFFWGGGDATVYTWDDARL